MSRVGDLRLPIHSMMKRSQNNEVFSDCLFISICVLCFKGFSVEFLCVTAFHPGHHDDNVSQNLKLLDRRYKSLSIISLSCFICSNCAWVCQQRFCCPYDSIFARKFMGHTMKRGYAKHWGLIFEIIAYFFVICRLKYKVMVLISQENVVYGSLVYLYGCDSCPKLTCCSCHDFVAIFWANFHIFPMFSPLFHYLSILSLLMLFRQPICYLKKPMCPRTWHIFSLFSGL